MDPPLAGVDPPLAWAARRVPSRGWAARRGWVVGRHRRFGLAVAGVLAAGLGACGLAQRAIPGLGVSNGSVSVCFRAIPTAKAAVHDRRAQVIGVHHLSVDQVAGHLPYTARPLFPGNDDSRVCAVAFAGQFAAGQVTQASPGEAGRFAVVLVSGDGHHVFRSVVLDHLPHALGPRSL